MSSKRPDSVRAFPDRAHDAAEAGPESFAPRMYAGTSGWAYASWKPGFYPEKLPARRFLEYYASRVNAVEVNYTFRTLPSVSMLEGWLAATPAAFRFSFKAPQRITHFNRLTGCEEQLTRFFSALEPVRAAGRLGPVLFQLPPNFKADCERLREFLDAVARAGAAMPRIAFEFRHASWFTEPVYDALREHGAALCIAEGDDLATPDVQCAPDFACFRLRRSGGYTSPEIAEFAERFRALAAEGREVYAFLRHEDQPTGALNAAELLAVFRREPVTESKRAEGE